MTDIKIPIYLETATKKSFACSVDWPGWCRSGKTEDAAIEALMDIAPRYAEVAELAHKRFPKIEPERFEVVERIEGNGTTDFGAPGKVPKADREPFDRSEADRLRDLLQASWDYLDEVVAKAPATLKKGPRGGGRDRDQVYQHVLGAAQGYARADRDKAQGTRVRGQRSHLRDAPADPGVHPAGGRSAREGLADPVRRPQARLAHPGPRLGDPGQVVVADSHS